RREAMHENRPSPQMHRKPDTRVRFPSPAPLISGHLRKSASDSVVPKNISFTSSMESTDLMANRQSLFAVTMSTRCLRTKTAWPLRRGGRRQSGQPSDEILGGKAATMGFRGDLLDGLLSFDESFFL